MWRVSGEVALRWGGRAWVVAVAIFLLAGGSAHAGSSTSGTSELVSTPTDHSSQFVAVSANGRYVLFNSARPLVAADTNHKEDVYLKDRRSRTTVRVSVGTGGYQLNGISRGAALTPDGRYVVFGSDARNLTPRRPGHWTSNVYIRDLRRGRTERVSVPAHPGQFCFAGMELLNSGADISAFVSANGEKIVFAADGCAGNQFSTHAFLRNRRTETTRRLVPRYANAVPLGASPALRYIAFGTSGLPPYRRLVIRDRYRSALIGVQQALPPHRTVSPSVFITRNASYIALSTGFRYGAATYRYDRATDTAVAVPGGKPRWKIYTQVIGMSADGRYIAFREDSGIYLGDMTHPTAPPLRADVGPTPINVWVVQLGMSLDAHTIGFTVTDAKLKTFTAYTATGIP